jgi:hypothetical protein
MLCAGCYRPVSRVESRNYGGLIFSSLETISIEFYSFPSILFMPDGYLGEPPETTECSVLALQFSIWWEFGELEHLDTKSIYLMGIEKLLW